MKQNIKKETMSAILTLLNDYWYYKDLFNYQDHIYDLIIENWIFIIWNKESGTTFSFLELITSEEFINIISKIIFEEYSTLYKNNSEKYWIWFNAIESSSFCKISWRDWSTLTESDKNHLLKDLKLAYIVWQAIAISKWELDSFFLNFWHKENENFIR
jgi:hypothetical protein